MTLSKILIPMLLTASFAGCAGTGKSEGKANSDELDTRVEILGSFSADSAYKYIADQVAFGPRVPGTPAHDLCRDYLVEQLRRHNADTVYVQHATVTAHTGEELPISNIFATFRSDAPRRILLVAHYDSRPWADRAHTIEARKEPVLGANDGGSGVAVILEIARNLNLCNSNVGVDILLTDAEDYGDTGGFNYDENTWSLGAQHWTTDMPYEPDNLPIYGILLDMVGGRDARFHYEAFSHRNARSATAKIWSEAQRLGLSGRFIPSVGGNITDDHVFITRAGIPTVNIIETINAVTTSFPETWHTEFDNLENIDRSSLQDVGNTVLNVIYKEKAY